MILTLLFAIGGYSPILILLGNKVSINQEICNANGVPNMYRQLQLEYTEKSNCGMTDLVFYLIHEDLNTYFRSKCAARSKSQNCITKSVSLSKQCLNAEDIKLLDNWEKIDGQLLDYTCNNYMENLSAFNQKEYKCWEEVNVALRNCSPKMHNTLIRGLYRSVNELTCRDFEEVEMCMRNKFPKYCNEQISDIVLTAIKTIGNNLCKIPTNYENEHKRVRRSVILRRIVREIGVGNKIHKIEHKVKNLCVTNGHPSEKLEETLEKMKKCANEKQMFVVPKQDYLDHIEKCSNKSIELFKSCLPEKYKYLPPLFLKIVESTISFLYDDFMIIASELGPCVEKLNSKESTEVYDKCVAKINIEDELIDSKEKFCRNWIPLNECYIKQVQKECKPSEELTKFENDFTEAITRPCKSKE